MLVDRRAGRGLSGVLGVDRGEIGFVVDDQCRQLAQHLLKWLEVLDELLERRRVLLHDHDVGVRVEEVLGRIERFRLVIPFVAQLRHAVWQALVVGAVRGDPSDARHPGLVERGIGVADEPAREPVLVLLVVETLRDLRVVRILSCEDVLDTHELHVDPALGLRAKDLDRAGHDDDETVAGVDGLGDDTREVGGLAALHVTDHQPLGLLDLIARRIGEALDDRVGAPVQGRDGGSPPLLHLGKVVLVVGPVEVASLFSCLLVPRLKVPRDHDGALAVDRDDFPEEGLECC
ncbi:hypothetical protein GS539_18705 [Rhodococcus hoagii]|nr:hypothetical protein [Prescottella equi]